MSLENMMPALVAFVFVSLVCGARFAEATRAPIFRNPHTDVDLLPGWLGSDHEPPRKHVDLPPGPGCRNLVVLDEEARIFLCKGFISAEEADHIRDVAERRLTRSGVVDAMKGSSKVSNIRTSYGTFLARGEDEVVKAVEKRIAEWTLLPVSNGEGLQVLRYELGQKYDAHWDYFFHKEGISNGGNRYATVLMYLEDTEEGGETTFPYMPAPGGENIGFSECARWHLAAKPIKGDAVLFHSIAPSGALERKSQHQACPVIKGTKWSAAKWIHVGNYVMDGSPFKAIDQVVNEVPKIHRKGVCDDLNDLCEEWATSGECTKNPVFMVGTEHKPGVCLLSCKRCDLFQPSAPVR